MIVMGVEAWPALLEFQNGSKSVYPLKSVPAHSQSTENTTANQSDQRQFLCECPVTQNVETIFRDMVSIHNLQARIQNLGVHGEQMSLYGPVKPKDAEDSDREEPSYS